MILRRAEALCRNASELEEGTVDGMLDVMHSATFDLSMLSNGMWIWRDCPELAQPVRERIIVENRFERRTLTRGSNVLHARCLGGAGRAGAARFRTDRWDILAQRCGWDGRILGEACSETYE